MSWFLIFFEMFSDSFVIKYKVRFCDCYTFVCLKYKAKFCDSLHCRDSFAQNTKANSVTVTSEIHLLECLKVAFCHLWLQSLIFEQKIVLVGSEKLSGNICNYIHGLDKCNTVFQNVKTVPLIRINKAHTKIS